MASERRDSRKRASPKPVTAAGLEASASFYLERFATSAANLRRVLMRRVRRSVQAHGTDPAEGAAMVEALIARWLKSGLLDDRAYATAKTASLHRRGRSARAIAAALAVKGIDRTLISESLAEGEAARPGGDLAAAVALARRRRLGPFRVAAEREAARQRDLGTFARAGFSRSVAERVLACRDGDEAAALPLTEP
ncbi:MAG TPA: RecX family transcriptional regulator [Caulobacteraceae bacterium]|nr:RecX family transcriptional regulator [Caulobacteraceae bacterium]